MAECRRGAISKRAAASIAIGIGVTELKALIEMRALMRAVVATSSQTFKLVITKVASLLLAVVADAAWDALHLRATVSRHRAIIIRFTI